MKNLFLLIILFLAIGHLDAQFSRAFGEPGLDFHTTQIKTLNGDTYISGWFFNPTASSPGNTEEGVVIRLDADGDPQWVYRLSPETLDGDVVGTRIYDFDFDDDESQVIFVGATNLQIGVPFGGFRDNLCTVGMINLVNGVDIFQQAYNFRTSSREAFIKIINDPNPVNSNSYFISGIINDPDTGPGTTDNYIGARAEITPGNVTFSWINEHSYAVANGQTPDQEMARMRILDVGGQTRVAFAGIDNPGLGTNNRNDPHLNLHDENGLLTLQVFFEQNGMIFDVAQIGNLLIVVGQLRENTAATTLARPFITGINVNTGQVITNSITFPTNQLTRFSRVELEPGSRDIMVVGERTGQNSVVCRFRLNPFAASLTYIGNTLLDFGTDEAGNGLLSYDGNNAYWADTRSGFASPLNNGEAAAAIVRTNFNLLSCESVSLELDPSPIELSTNDDKELLIDPLGVDPILLQPIQASICPLEMCGPSSVGINFTSTIVPHGSNSEYVTLTDFNQDGWQDFAVPDLRYGTTPQFSISQNNQNLTFNSFNTLASNPSYISDGESMELLQLDGLRGPDVIVHRQGRFEIYLHQGGTDFLLAQTEWVTSAAPPSTANLIGVYRSDFDLADHNGDQILDLVITGATTGGGPTPRIAIFRGTGNTSAPFFAPTPMMTLPGLPAISYWETKHVDINNDNRNDLLTGQAGYNGTTQSIFGYLNNGSPTTPFPATHNLEYETPSAFIWPRGLEIKDITGNGQLDLIATMQAEELVGGTPTGNGALIIARNMPTSAGFHSSASLQWQVFNIPGQPVGIDIGDIDSDGDQDVVVAVHYPSAFVRVYENNGNGNFTNFTDYATPGGYTTEVMIADFNNDCCKDIVTAQWHGNSSYVLFNDCEASEFFVNGQVRCEDIPCNFLGPAAPNQLVSVTNGNTTYYGLTNSNGMYNISVPQGTYDVALVNGNYGSPACAFNTNVYTNDISGITPANSATVNFAMESACELDVNMIGAIIGTTGVNTCPFIATPCEDLIWEYCIEIENNTCSTKPITQITVDLPHGINTNVITNAFVECGTQTPVSFGTPVISTYSGAFPNLFSNTVTYSNVNAIGAGECYSACLEVTFNGGFTLPISAETNVFFTCDGQRGRETDVVSYQDTCSCDPNLKLAYFPQSCGTPDEVLDQPIEYTIQFSNIGQSPAYYVLIEDQLDANLDWSTFQWLGSSHSVTSMTLTSGLLAVDFSTIILPPAGTGWIKFSVKPLSNIPNYTIISNAADITFDSNAPVSTNTTTTQILFPNVDTDLQFDQESYCIGETMYIDYLWTGDAAWLNYSQNGNLIGQNVPAPPSGTQTTFHISNFSYVGAWDYELIAIDSLTGCTDTTRFTILIDDCVCEDAFTGAQTVSRNCKGVNLQTSAHHQLSGSTLTLWDTSTPTPDIQIVRFGDGTELVYNPAQPVITYTYASPGYYVIEYVAVIMLDDGSCCVDTYYLEIEIPEGEGGDGNDGGNKSSAKTANPNTHIYPNPATHQVTIQSPIFKEVEASLYIQLYTVAGRLLKTYNLSPDHDRVQLELDNDYQGLLLVRISTQAGELLVEERFIKMDK